MEPVEEREDRLKRRTQDALAGDAETVREELRGLSPANQAMVGVMLAEIDVLAGQRDDWRARAETSERERREALAEVRLLSKPRDSGTWDRLRHRAEVAEARLAAVEEAAKRAKSQAASSDYDEEAIRDALWAVVDAALAHAPAAAAVSSREETGGDSGG